MKWFVIPHFKGVYFSPQSSVVDIQFPKEEHEVAIVTYPGGFFTRCKFIGGEKAFREVLCSNKVLIEFILEE